MARESSRTRCYRVLRWIAYLFVLVGAYVGANDLTGSGGVERGVFIFSMLGIFPLSFLAFIWHTFLGSEEMAAGSPFFEREVGGTNLAIAITLLVAWLSHWGVAIFATILLIYFIYLLVASICHGIYKNKWSALIFLPILILLAVFILLAWGVV